MITQDGFFYYIDLPELTGVGGYCICYLTVDGRVVVRGSELMDCEMAQLRAKAQTRETGLLHFAEKKSDVPGTPVVLSNISTATRLQSSC